MIQNIIHWLIETIFQLGYPGIVVLMAIESSVFPLPSEIVIPPAGVLAAQGRMNVVLVVLSGTVGSIIGALANYALAAWLGRPLLHRYARYLLVSEASLNRAEAFFRRHGEISTFTSRLIPVLRHLVSLPAGIARMPLVRFSLYTGMGAGIWCAILAAIGWYAGSHAQLLGDQAVRRYSAQATLLLIPALLVILAVYVYFQRRKVASS